VTGSEDEPRRDGPQDPDGPGGPGGSEVPPPQRGRGRARRDREESAHERLLRAQAWAAHLAEQRARHRAEVEQAQLRPVVTAGATNFTRAQVPYGVDLAAAWSWRFLVIIGATGVVLWMASQVMLVLIPLFVALFIAALAAPVVHAMANVLPRGIATLMVVLSLIGLVVLMLVLATEQVVDGANDLAEQVVVGLDQIREWLRDGPLHATDQQIDDAIQSMQDLVVSSNQELVGRVTDVGTAISNIVAAFFIALFATYFFLADGQRIWLWVVRIFPRAARKRADASGRVAWLSLTQFVRATVLVAAVDAIGIMVVAAILKVPFVMAIGVLVFLSSFVPLVGATVSGAVVVLVALVAQGPLAALLMAVGVIGVQQVEAQLLQPFLLGRMVSIHPLGVILAVACGIIVAGIVGALIAVPLVACANAVVTYLSADPPPSVTDGSPLSSDSEIASDPGQ
jgi:predicted PurR-regulated permease PerM